MRNARFELTLPNPFPVTIIVTLQMPPLDFIVCQSFSPVPTDTTKTATIVTISHVTT